MVFLSPIEVSVIRRSRSLVDSRQQLSDPVLQSLPLSYVSLQAASNDGWPHDVQVYLDITGGTVLLLLANVRSVDESPEWLTYNRSEVMTWSIDTTNQIVSHQLNLANPGPFDASNGQARDASVWHAMLNSTVGFATDLSI